jgi:hypothetical protein
MNKKNTKYKKQWNLTKTNPKENMRQVRAKSRQVRAKSAPNPRWKKQEKNRFDGNLRQVRAKSRQVRAKSRQVRAKSAPSSNISVISGIAEQICIETNRSTTKVCFSANCGHDGCDGLLAGLHCVVLGLGPRPRLKQRPRSEPRSCLPRACEVVDENIPPTCLIWMPGAIHEGPLPTWCVRAPVKRNRELPTTIWQRVLHRMPNHVGATPDYVSWVQIGPWGGVKLADIILECSKPELPSILGSLLRPLYTT